MSAPRRERSSSSPQADRRFKRPDESTDWEIVPRAGFAWGHPLYVDAQEFALVEGAGPAVTVDAGLTPGESYTVLRYTIDSLGAPTML